MRLQFAAAARLASRAVATAFFECLLSWAGQWLRMTFSKLYLQTGGSLQFTAMPEVSRLTRIQIYVYKGEVTNKNQYYYSNKICHKRRSAEGQKKGGGIVDDSASCNLIILPWFRRVSLPSAVGGGNISCIVIVMHNDTSGLGAHGGPAFGRCAEIGVALNYR